MNIVLLEHHELGSPLPPDDRRAHHIIHHLRKQPGDRLKAGVINQSLGWLHITQLDSRGVHYWFEATDTPAPAQHPITVLIGHPRPPAARRLLIDLTALGAANMVFFCADNSEKSYIKSSLWHATTTAQLLKQGLEYAGAVHLPTATITANLAAAIDTAHHIGHTTNPPVLYRWCCITPSDHAGHGHPTGIYSAINQALNQHHANHPPHIVLAIGAERGWTANELNALTAHHFAPCIIGRRTVRTETAAIGAVTTAIAVLTNQLL